MSLPCPICDAMKLTGLEKDDLRSSSALSTALLREVLVAVAFGVGLGATLGMHGVTPLVCKEHRAPWMRAMVACAAGLNGEARS